MRAQKKSFWITLVLTIISLGVMIPLFLVSPEYDRPLFEILRVVLSGISTGLLVATIMAFVFHRNERDKYMRKLYDKARSTYHSMQQLTVAIDDKLSCFENKEVALSCAEYYRTLVNNAVNSHFEYPLYVGEFTPLISRKTKYTKTESMVSHVLSEINVVVDFSTEINGLLSASSIQEYKTSDDRVAFLFPAFLNLKTRVSEASNILDSRMATLDERYKFDYSWVNTTKLVNERIKSNGEQGKIQHRNAVLVKINQHHRNNDLVKDFGEFLPNLFSNPDFINTIKAVAPILAPLATLFAKSAGVTMPTSTESETEHLSTDDIVETDIKADDTEGKED